MANKWDLEKHAKTSSKKAIKEKKRTKKGCSVIFLHYSEAVV